MHMRLPIIAVSAFALIVVLVTGNWPFISDSIFANLTWGLYSREFFENILVEAHGTLIDLFVGGVVVYWFEQRRNRSSSIKRHLETLADLRFYRGTDASHRVFSEIKRLLELKVHSLKLSEAMLDNLEIANIAFDGFDFRAANLASTHLTYCAFCECDCDAIILVGARLKHVTLRNVKLRRAKLIGAQLNGCDFTSCKIESADFTNADLRSAVFKGVDCAGVSFKGADLRSVNFLGAKNLTPQMLAQAKNTKYIKL